jgi:hypothetical protein
MTAEEKRSLPREAQRAVLQVVSQLEQRIETQVQAALAKVRAPIDREMDAMRSRLEKLGQKLDALRSRRRS